MEHVTVRIPAETLEKVDQYREKLEKSTGIPVKRADALRAAIEVGVDVKLEELARKG